MSGTKSRLTALALRKQLLLAESEVNRVQLINEWQHLAHETCTLARHAQSVCTSVTSVVTTGMAGFKAMREMRAASRGKSSWIAKAFNGVRLGTALWKSFRSS